MIRVVIAVDYANECRRLRRWHLQLQVGQNPGFYHLAAYVICYDYIHFQ
jgi:hypothetical protein